MTTLSGLALIIMQLLTEPAFIFQITVHPLTHLYANLQWLLSWVFWVKKKLRTSPFWGRCADHWCSYLSIENTRTELSSVVECSSKLKNDRLRRNEEKNPHFSFSQKEQQRTEHVSLNSKKVLLLRFVAWSPTSQRLKRSLEWNLFTATLYLCFTCATYCLVMV